MLYGHRLNQHVMDTLGKLLRPTLIPEDGKVFVVNDWSSVENRMLPWLSGDPRAQDKLDAFVRIDNDPKALDTYQLAAADAGVTDRQIGKVIELSLGFLGANGAFNSMARNYGIHLPDHEVTRIVKAWRRKNAWAVDFGNALEKAALKAMRNPNTGFMAGRVMYILRVDVLECILPSGTVISYPDAKLEHDPQWDKITITALKANWTPSAGDVEWPRFKLWRGLLAENATQAECATLLREAMNECDQTDIPIVLHCHDELVAEVAEDVADYTARSLQRIMETPPQWATGLPLKAVPTIVKRYGK
jgi:DNA polymerase